MAEDSNLCTGVLLGCCILVVAVALLGGFGPSNSSSTTNIVVNDTLPVEEEALPILNRTNVTLNTTRMTFVYYDHNSTNFNGCYGLNYTVLTDKNNNRYMLDHATTDIIGEKTNYTFNYPNGLCLVFDNNTETEIYNNTKLYYVHEVRDTEDNIIKSLGNFTLKDDSHQPSFIPTNWTFVYTDHNSSKYEGDDGLSYAVTDNAIGNHEKNVEFPEDVIIGLMYYSNNSTDFYKYGLKGGKLDKLNESHHTGTYANGNSFDVYNVGSFNPMLPNGTTIHSFSVESRYLTIEQKDFLEDFDRRRDEYLKREEINAIYEAEDDLYTSYIRHNEKQKNKPTRGYYMGAHDSGIFRTY